MPEKIEVFKLNLNNIQDGFIKSTIEKFANLKARNKLQFLHDSRILYGSPVIWGLNEYYYDKEDNRIYKVYYEE